MYAEILLCFRMLYISAYNLIHIICFYLNNIDKFLQKYFIFIIYKYRKNKIYYGKFLQIFKKKKYNKIS